MNSNYFFIDGSALTAQIRQLQRSDASFKGRKLCPRKFIEHFVTRLRRLHGGSYKRATFYFPKGDEVGIEDYILVPDHTVPGEVDDMHFKFCGQKLKKSADFLKFVEESVPPQFQDRFQKSEKGVDTEICCDALRLSSTGRLERLFLLSNDSDMIPLCRTLKEFGSNVSILHLSPATQPNRELLQEADTYDVVSTENLSSMFLPVPEPQPITEIPHDSPPVAEPPQPSVSNEKETGPLDSTPGEESDAPSEEDAGDGGGGEPKKG